MNFIKPIIKRIKSYSKKEWEFEDYPIKVWQIFDESNNHVTFRAGIQMWIVMNEDGSTKELAIESLRKRFNDYKVNNEELPRPGTTVPLKYASNDQMDKYEKTAVHFFDKILEMNYYDGFFSDGTVLLYFEPNDDEDIEEFRIKIIEKVRDSYDVDISQMYDEPLWKIFKLIEEN